MLIQKTLALDEAEFKFDDQGGGRFAGYASTFNGVDAVKDTILRGAFDATIKEHGLPKMFFNHAWDLPIGKYLDVHEDSRGLFVEGELTPGLQRANDVKAALRHRTIDGLSIGGFVKRGDYEEAKDAGGKFTGGRVIRKWSRLVEVSPVVFGADQSARIETVKGEDMQAAISEIESVRDLERLLRDVAGFGKGAAVALVSKARTILAGDPPRDSDDADRQMRDIVARINALADAAH
jgi:HK97 family phage prohead protease